MNKRWQRTSRFDGASIVQTWASDYRLPRHAYRFVTWWRVDATAAAVWDAVIDPEDLVRWFPATFLESRRSGRAESLRVGSRIDFHVRGWLPYTLRFHARIVQLDYCRGCTAIVSGDFDGTLVFAFEESDGRCTVRFDWNVRVHKPLVRRLSFALKPLFCTNHAWVMLRGWQSLRVELARRSAIAAASRS